MTTNQFGGPIAAGSYPNAVETDRMMLQSMFAQGGVHAVGMFDATAVVGARQLSLAAGTVIIPGSAASQGSYFYSADGPTIVSFSAPAANPRIDAVILEAVDAQYGTDPIAGVTSGTFTWAVVNGTPAASPTAPSDADINAARGRPGAWMRMYNVQVQTTATTDLTGANSIISRKFKYTSGLGGIIPVYDVTDLATEIPSPKLGQIAYISRYDIFYRYNGSAWNQATAYRKEVVLSSTTGSVTFSDIPRFLKTIRLSIQARSDTAANDTTVNIRYGGDSGNLYGSAIGYFQNGPTTSGASTSNASSAALGYIPANSLTAGRWGSVQVDIPAWDLPNSKAQNLQGNSMGGYIVGTTFRSGHGVHEYVGTATLTSITLLPAAGSFIAGSAFRLEGLY